MKTAEKYQKSRVRKYGIAIEKFGPFQRQLQIFKTEQGRQQILQCCKSQLKLAGNPCGGGIPECIQIDTEMDDLSDLMDYNLLAMGKWPILRDLLFRFRPGIAQIR